MIVFVVAFQASNISAIILSSQTMDTTLVAMFKRSVALQIYPNFGGTSTADGVSGDSPFGDAYVISVGFIVILCLTIPMGYFNLDDNIWVQKGAFLMLILCLLTWTGQFIGLGLDPNNMPVVSGGGFNQLGVLHPPLTSQLLSCIDLTPMPGARVQHPAQLRFRRHSSQLGKRKEK